MSAESQILAAAAKEAQRILAPMADPDAEGDFTVVGLTGTFTAVGNGNTFELVPTSNGFEKQYQLRLSAARNQFTAAQETTLESLATTRARVTAIGNAWNLTSVTIDAQFIQLVAVIA